MAELYTYVCQTELECLQLIHQVALQMRAFAMYTVIVLGTLFFVWLIWVFIKRLIFRGHI